MTPIQYLKQITVVLPQIARQTGHPSLCLYLNFLRCFLGHHIQLEEFQASHMYDFSGQKLSEFLTERRRARQARLFNAGATRDDFSIFNEKHRFNTLYQEYVHRDWLYIPEARPEEIRAFIARNPKFMAKADASTQGRNIFLHHSSDLDISQFLQEYDGKPFLLETFIRQHPSMSALNPSSVNTVRIVTARYNGQVMLVGACLRCGGQNSHVDNFHKGGIAYPLDVETGIVCARGRTLQGRAEYIRHPSSGHIMLGFQIPYWAELKEQLIQAALLAPHIGYIGWDIAITEDGPEFVEGNVNSPDPIVIQLDDNGVYRKLEAFLKGEPESHP